MAFDGKQRKSLPVEPRRFLGSRDIKNSLPIRRKLGIAALLEAMKDLVNGKLSRFWTISLNVSDIYISHVDHYS